MASDRRNGDDVADHVRADVQTRLDHYFRRHADWLGRAIRQRFSGAAIEPDDIVQEAYLRFARYAEGDRAHRPRALLLAIASNLARDALRRARRAGGSAGISSDPHELPFEPDQYEQLLLKQLILALPPPYREVFLLSRFTAMTYEDIARHCGISVKTVEWRMSKALALCNQALGR